MPLSEPSRRALEAAVRLNPTAALQLASILVTAPRAIKYKPDDQIGPLGLLVRPAGAPAAASPTLSGLVRPVLPVELKEAAEVFRREWITRRFSKAELAHAIRRCLEDMGTDCRSLDAGARMGAWRVTAAAAGSVGEALDGFFPRG